MVFVHGSAVLGVDLTSHILPSRGFANFPTDLRISGPNFRQNREEQHEIVPSGTTARNSSGTTVSVVLPPQTQRYYHDHGTTGSKGSGTTARRQKLFLIFVWHSTSLVLESSSWCNSKLPQLIIDDITARLKCTLTPPSPQVDHRHRLTSLGITCILTC